VSGHSGICREQLYVALISYKLCNIGNELHRGPNSFTSMFAVEQVSCDPHRLLLFWLEHRILLSSNPCTVARPQIAMLCEMAEIYLNMQTRAPLPPKCTLAPL
jgi:hypothetical protein